MTILTIMFCASGLLLAGLSIPLILGKIPPNGLYGFRVRKTMEHPEIWYPVNRYGGKWLFVSGLGIALAAALFTLIPDISVDMYAYLVLGVLVILSGLGMVLSFRYLEKL